ncbi:hypothetical protein ACHWUR_23330 [Klebsiella pneumoniae]
MKRIMLAVFVICGALSLSGCFLPLGLIAADMVEITSMVQSIVNRLRTFILQNEKGRKIMRPLVTTNQRIKNLSGANRERCIYPAN